jgi:YbbR domain-containing protein
MRIVPRNLSVWFVSIALAVLLWVHVVTNKLYEQIYSLPLRVAAVPAGLMVTSDIPDSCQIRVRGSGKALIRFSLEVKSLLFRASDYAAGTHVIDLEPKAFQVGDIGAAEIIEVVSPKKLRLRLEERSEKVLRIVPDIAIQTASGSRQSGRVTVSPDTALVRGPKRILKKMDSIATEKREFANISGRFQERVRLALPDSAFLSLSDTFVTVSAETARLAERTIGSIPVMIDDFAADKVLLTPSSVSLVVEAPTEILDSVSAASFSASIDKGKLRSGSSRIVPTIKVPHGVKLVEIVPNEIRVEVRGE